jgi:hypothetical protein
MTHRQKTARFGAHALALLAFAVTLTACGKTETPAPATASSAAAPANNTPATGTVSGHSFKITDGADLAAVKNQQMLHPQFELTPDEVDAPVIFGVVQNDEKKTSSPVILKKFGAAWKIIEVNEARDQEWAYVAACPPRNELFGILDAAGDAPSSQLTLLRSPDKGTTWQYFSAVKKITPAAEYAGFSISKTGEGRLTMHLEEDDDEISHGYYHYKTADGGKTWTGPSFEPDDVVEADSLKRFDTVQEAIRATETPATPNTPEGAPRP